MHTNLKQFLHDAILKAEWSDGYDRNGSHDAGEYREYTSSLSDEVGDTRAAVLSCILAEHIAEELVSDEELLIRMLDDAMDDRISIEELGRKTDRYPESTTKKEIQLENRTGEAIVLSQFQTAKVDTGLILHYPSHYKTLITPTHPLAIIGQSMFSTGEPIVVDVINWTPTPVRLDQGVVIGTATKGMFVDSKDAELNDLRPNEQLLLKGNE